MGDLQTKLNQCAFVVRKYNLDYRKFFFSSLDYLKNSKLEIAWNYALKKIQNKDIIKDAPNLSTEELNIVNLRINAFDDTPVKLYDKLLSKFDVKEFRLKDERIERRVRKILAIKFLQNIHHEIKQIKENEFLKSKSLIFFNKVKYTSFTLFLITLLFTPRIIEGLTTPRELLNKYLHENYTSIKSDSITVKILTNYLHEDSKYKSSGAFCNDGSLSYSQGRGTCSHHGGVNYYFYSGEYSEDMEECRKSAIKSINELKEKAYQNSWRN